LAAGTHARMQVSTLEANQLIIVFHATELLRVTVHPTHIHIIIKVGVGALVLNERGEMLAVQERSGNLKGRSIWWGLVVATH
jgi:hypothetical protein